jgi:hypothetical protein
MPSCMGIFKKKCTWNNLLAISTMTLALYATLGNVSMVLSKLLVLVLEPYYLPDSEVFVFQPFLYPMNTVHPGRLYTPPHGGVAGGGL